MTASSEPSASTVPSASSEPSASTVPSDATRLRDVHDVDGGDGDRVEELLDVARVAKTRAHCPYSNYAVGAAIRAASGEIYAGCNVENAAYPEGTCAEAGAIAAMVLAGEREIAEVAVVTGGATPGTPCGGCRQRLREFAAPGVQVHAANETGAMLTISMADLLPDSFGPDDLR